MQMRQCVNGHFYDQQKTLECPYCNDKSANVNIKITAKSHPLVAEIGSTVPLASPGVMNDGKTMAMIQKSMGIDPVVGWLVCTRGKEKGRDYSVHSDNNFIGRSEKMDICITGDDTISRDNHAIISYDMADRRYYFSPGERRSIVRHNGRAIFTTVELRAYDRILLGNTEFVFMPLCGEAFSWTK